MINRGVECDLYTAQGFEALGAVLTGAVTGSWQIPDADKGTGITGFSEKGELWKRRRVLARDFWVDA
ncbi:MAG: hypothetical protein JRD02_01960 [Deltaproteobacteria bacterium]|nr:hypothetical protein [Deltaproteobacteria bacterium]